MEAIIDDMAPRLTQAELAAVLYRRRGERLSMTVKVGTDTDGSLFTVFSFFSEGLAGLHNFAELYHPGDWRENGSEANSLHGCFRYFFKIEEREEE